MGSKKVLRTVIVDDEQLAIDLLQDLLSGMSQIEIIGTCSNGRQAISMVRELSPDLLIMDIQMPGINGFGVVEKLQADVMPSVIFATAYDQYALQAFDINVVDYVLKPIDKKRLQQAVNRAILRNDAATTEQTVGSESQYKGAVMSAAQQLSQQTQAKNPSSGRLDTANTNHQVLVKDGAKLIVRDASVTTFVEFNDIYWIDAAGDYMCVHTEQKTHILRATLKSLLDVLPKDSFKQIHRSTIVHLDHIEEVKVLPKGERLLKLHGNERLKMSRTYKSALDNFLN